MGGADCPRLLTGVAWVEHWFIIFHFGVRISQRKQVDALR